MTGLKIRTWLRLVMVVIVTLMIAGVVVASWQLGVVRRHNQQIYRMDALLISVRNAQADVAGFQERLRRLAATPNAARFADEAAVLRHELQADVGGVETVLPAVFDTSPRQT